MLFRKILHSTPLRSVLANSNLKGLYGHRSLKNNVVKASKYNLAKYRKKEQ